MHNGASIQDLDVWFFLLTFISDLLPRFLTREYILEFAGSFAGLGFLALYLSGKIKCFDGRGHVAKLCILFLPILAACLVGVSRVDDYWHHWQDVFAGGLLGAYLSCQNGIYINFCCDFNQISNTKKIL